MNNFEQDVANAVMEKLAGWEARYAKVNPKATLGDLRSIRRDLAAVQHIPRGREIVPSIPDGYGEQLPASYALQVQTGLGRMHATRQREFNLVKDWQE